MSAPSSHAAIVLGAGISGLALAHGLVRTGCGDVAVLEASDRPGGKVRTEWLDRWCCEWGPQGFLDNVPEMLELVDQLGLRDDLRRADEAAGDRFIVRGGRLRRVPLSPPAFLGSDILSLRGRLRVLLEPLGRRARGDESVFAFASRRIGREAAEVLVDAMVTGVYAGDPRQLSLPATFPRMRRMEEEHGSLFRAMLSRRRQGGGGGPAGPGGTLTTFRLGMQQLTDTLADRLGHRVVLGATVEKATPCDGGWRIGCSDGRVFEAPTLAVALPPRQTAAVLAEVLDGPAEAALQDIPSVPVAVVVTGYRSPQPFRHPARGFGFLVPGREGRQILGTIFCSATFPEQAPPHATLLRTLVGGARRPDLAALPDDELVGLVRRELASLLGGDPDPDVVRVIRHREAIAQYTLGHLDRVAAVRRRVGELPGLHVLGQGFDGVAVNACVAEASRLVRTVTR